MYPDTHGGDMELPCNDSPATRTSSCVTVPNTCVEEVESPYAKPTTSLPLTLAEGYKATFPSRSLHSLQLDTATQRSEDPVSTKACWNHWAENDSIINANR